VSFTTKAVVLPPGCKHVEEIAPGNPESIHNGLHHSEHPLADYWARYIAPEFGGPAPYDGFVDSALNVPAPAGTHLITVSTADAAVDSDDDVIPVRADKSGQSPRNNTPIDSRPSRSRKRQISTEQRESCPKRLATGTTTSSRGQSGGISTATGILATAKRRLQSHQTSIRSPSPEESGVSPGLDYLQSLGNSSSTQFTFGPGASFQEAASDSDLYSINDKDAEPSLPGPNTQTPFSAQSQPDQDAFLEWFSEGCKDDRELRTLAIQTVFATANPRDLILSHQQGRLRIKRLRRGSLRESTTLWRAEALFAPADSNSSAARPLPDVVDLE
jgi:hypothetical protein